MSSELGECHNAAAGANTTALYFDKITDFTVGTDIIKMGTGAGGLGGLTLTAATVVNVRAAVAIASGALTDFTAAAAAIETAQAGVASTAATLQATVVTFGTMTTATGFANKTFLVINDDTAGIAVTDMFIDITGVSGTIVAGSFLFGAS